MISCTGRSRVHFYFRTPEFLRRSFKLIGLLLKKRHSIHLQAKKNDDEHFCCCCCCCVCFIFSMSRGKAPNLCDMRVKKECTSRNKTKQNKKMGSKTRRRIGSHLSGARGILSSFRTSRSTVTANTPRLLSSYFAAPSSSFLR